MKVILDFVHRNDNNNNQNRNGNDDGPLQLIRPMPNILRNYVTNTDYENLCIRKIDPLLGALYDAEKTERRLLIFSSLLIFVLFAICCAISLMMGIIAIAISVFIAFFCVTVVIMIIVSCYVKYPGRQIQKEMRTECKNMSNQFSTSTGGQNKNVCFKLVMKNVVQRDSDGNAHYSQVISHIEVTISGKKDDCEVPDLAQMKC